MKLGNWFAVLGCVGIGFGAVLNAPGCTVTVGPCDGGNCGTFPGEDSAVPVNDSSPGIDTGITADTGTGDTGSTPVDPCNSCLYGQCVGAYSDCIANTSCLTIYQCATSPACAADGGTCVQDCFNAGNATGQTKYLALGDCDQGAECTNVKNPAPCASTCNPSAETCAVADAGPPVDSGTNDAGGDAAALSCTDCQSTLCASQLAACAAGTACANYNQCVLGCTNAGCTSMCQTNYSAGAAQATALGTCTTNSCPQCN